MFTASKALAPRSLASKLEVERKFVPSALLKEYASKNSLSPRTSLLSTNNHTSRVYLRRLPSKRITDKYFDHDGQLERKGMWVRWREEIMTDDDDMAGPRRAFWEAKVKQGGDFLDSQFVEATGRDAVETLMSEAKVCDSVHDLNFQLGFVADRLSWAVEGFADTEQAAAAADDTAMTLVLDAMTAALEGHSGEHAQDMHHQVGELELEKTITTSLTHESSSEAELIASHHASRADEGAMMQKRLTTFMTDYPDIFNGTGLPLGKITAYMERKERIAAGVTKANAAARLASVSETEFEKVE